jgi:hypothetical protein
VSRYVYYTVRGWLLEIVGKRLSSVLSYVRVLPRRGKENARGNRQVSSRLKENPRCTAGVCVALRTLRL